MMLVVSPSGCTSCFSLQGELRGGSSLWRDVEPPLVVNFLIYPTNLQLMLGIGLPETYLELI